MILSQIPTPSSLEVTAWIGCLFFLVAGWNQVEKFLDRRSQRAVPHEIQPQPLSVTKFDPPVVESLCRSRRQEVGNEVARVRQEVGELREERRVAVSELRQKLGKVDREVGELRASLELSHQQLARIDAKLDRVIEHGNR
jgi:hypothetical protein